MNSVKANAGSLRAVLKGLNLSEYADLLERENIDLEILADVKEEQLERIGVKTLGERLKILRAAKKAETPSKKQSVEQLEAKLRGRRSQEKEERNKAAETDGEGKTDEGERKDSEERKENSYNSSVGKRENKIEEKSEDFLANTKTSSRRGSFFAESKKMLNDERNSRKGIKQRSQKEIEDKTQKETKDESQKETTDKSQKGTKDNIDGKFEKSLKNQKASWGPDPEWKSPFKSDSDSTEDCSSKEMSTTGGMLFTAAMLTLKMMEAK